MDYFTAQDRVTMRTRHAYGTKIRWPENGKSPDIPKEAMKGALLNLKEKITDDILSAAQAMLQEQPIWTRHEFYQVLSKKCPNLLKEQKRFVLPGLTFRLSNGPWTRSWCRYGYDPGSNPDCRKYQTLDYRINQAILTKRRTISKKNTPKENSIALRELVEKLEEKLGNVENARGVQFGVQLYRLERIPELANLINDKDRFSNVCDFKEGFFKKNTMETLRLELTYAIAREDPKLEGLPEIIRGLKQIGLFRMLTMPAAGIESDDEGDAE